MDLHTRLRYDMIGQTISHYDILEKLGEGRMGVVYKAHDTKFQNSLRTLYVSRWNFVNPAAFWRDSKDWSVK